MTTQRKNQLSQVMTLAWQFVKRNGMNISEALRRSWRNIKLRAKMMTSIAKFWFVKVNGEIREAYGTLSREHGAPVTEGAGRKPNDSVQVYFDTERREFRCFKKANLFNIA